MILRTDRERGFWCEVYLQAQRRDKTHPEDAADGAIEELRERTAEPICPKCGEPLVEDEQHWVVTGGLGTLRICRPCCASLKVELNPTKPPPAKGAN